jgi:hypothetical protein
LEADFAEGVFTGSGDGVGDVVVADGAEDGNALDLFVSALLPLWFLVFPLLLLPGSLFLLLLVVILSGKIVLYLLLHLL